MPRQSRSLIVVGRPACNIKHSTPGADMSFDLKKYEAQVRDGNFSFTGMLLEIASEVARLGQQERSTSKVVHNLCNSLTQVTLELGLTDAAAEALAGRVDLLEELTGDPEFKEVPEQNTVAYGEPLLPDWSAVCVVACANGYVVSEARPPGMSPPPESVRVFTDWTQLQSFCRRVLEQKG
jgi:hypothetical protein